MSIIIMIKLSVRNYLVFDAPPRKIARGEFY